MNKNYIYILISSLTFGAILDWNAPASIDLRVYPVKIDGDQISVGLPKTNS